jgi:hypothetical protein
MTKEERDYCPFCGEGYGRPCYETEIGWEAVDGIKEIVRLSSDEMKGNPDAILTKIHEIAKKL